MPFARRADSDKPNLLIGSLNPSKALNVDKILPSTYKDAISLARFNKKLGESSGPVAEGGFFFELRWRDILRRIESYRLFIAELELSVAVYQMN